MHAARPLVVAVAASLLLAVSASTAGGETARVLRLAPGDEVTLAASSVRCSVSATGGAPTIACGKAGATGPQAGSYGFSIADGTFVVVKASRTSMPVQVATRTQPPVVGTTYPGSASGGRSLTVKSGAAMTVTGTHVFCAVSTVSAQPYVTCGIADGSGSFLPKSFVGVLSDTQLVVVRKLAKNGSKTVLTRLQPTR